MKQTLTLTKTQTDLLAKLTTATTSPQRLVLRAKLLLAYARSGSTTIVAADLATTREAVRRWRDRWRQYAGELADLEAKYHGNDLSAAHYAKELAAILADAPRPGAPPTFSEDQRARIIALATEEPEQAGIPITHWTCDTLRDAAVDKGIVPTISRSRVNVFLKHGHPPTAPQ
jgi:putative transposase